MSSDINRRKQPRLASEDKLFVEIMAAENRADIVGLVLNCTTIDISPTGIRLTLPMQVQKGTRLDLWIDSQMSAKKFFLHGEVMWCNFDPQIDQCQAGLEIKDHPMTDYLTWQAHYHLDEAQKNMEV